MMSVLSAARAVLLAGFCAFASACAVSAAPAPQILSTDAAAPHAAAAAAERLLQPWASAQAPGVSVAVSMKGAVVFAKGAGRSHLEHDAPITPRTVFQAASVSKQFTAFAALLLVSEGRMGLDDDIRLYLPELPAYRQTITLRHLLDHMSGLREEGTLAAMAGYLEDDVRSHAHVIRLLTAQVGVNFEAGARVEYSNSGYGLLAEIIERVAGAPFEKFMQARIFSPLAMNDTRISADRHEVIAGRAQSYAPAGENFTRLLHNSEILGSTGLVTTAPDLLKWAENFQTQKVGGDDVFAAMAARAAADNGDGSTFARGQEKRAYNGFETWSHGGRIAGYRSFLLRIPQADFALAILSNRSDFDTAKLAFALVDVFLADHPSFAKEKAPDWAPAGPAELAAYQGHYELFPGQIFTLSTDADGLWFAPLGAGDAQKQLLPQIGPRQFMLTPQADIYLEFEAPENGKSPALHYTIGLHGALEAKRIALAPFDPASLAPEDYAGVYYNQALDTSYVITVDVRQLIVSHHRYAPRALAAYQPDVFSAIGGGVQKFQFTRNAAGAVTGFKASLPVSENVEFVRQPESE